MAELEDETQPTAAEVQSAFNWAILTQLNRIYDILLLGFYQDDDEKAEAILEFHRSGRSYCPPPAIADEDAAEDRAARDTT